MQSITDSSARSHQAAQLKGMMDNRASQQQTIQKKNNNTGVMGAKAVKMEKTSGTATIKTEFDGANGDHAVQRQLAPAHMCSTGQVVQREQKHTSIGVLGEGSVTITATDNFATMGNVVHGANAAVTPARPIKTPEPSFRLTLAWKKKLCAIPNW